MNEPLVSIIIPIYNVEKWLNKNLESCINQSYQNLEIIAVNDGSTDKSKELILDYCEKDRRVILVDKINGGRNSARKAGIKRATGEFITILDGDDFLELDSIETLLSFSLKNDLDVAGGAKRYIRSSTNEVIGDITGLNSDLLIEWDYMRFILTKGELSTCMKLYKKKVLKNETLYPKIKANQDLPLTIQWATRVKRARFTSRVVYNYVISRPGSVTSGDKKLRVEASFDSLYFTFRWITQQNCIKHFLSEILNLFSFRLYLYLYGNNNFNENNEFIKEIANYIIKNGDHLNGKQYKMMARFSTVNVFLGHWFVYFSQVLKPTLSKKFDSYY